MKWIKNIPILFSVIILIFLTQCKKDDIEEVNIGEPNAETSFNWKVTIKQSGNYSEFIKTLSVEGGGNYDHSWLMNGANMEIIAFDLSNPLIIVQNDSLKYPNLEVTFRTVPYLQDSMNIEFIIQKDTTIIDNKSYFINGDKDIVLKY